MTTELVTKKGMEMVEREQVVMARNPEELNAAQQQMINWADHRLSRAREELKDLEANILLAQENNWGIQPWKRRIRVTQRTITYYQKVKAALQQGYCIIPNFPIDVFAVRTKKTKPNRVCNRARGHYGPTMPAINADQSPLGEGDYVSPETINNVWDEEHKNKEDQLETWHYAESSEFAQPDFPFTMVKPTILEDASFAKTVKIFDELGVMPDRRRRSGGDPVIIGRIKMSNSWASRAMSFLISWWVDPEEF